MLALRIVAPPVSVIFISVEEASDPWGMQASAMAQGIKVLAAKPSDTSSIPRTHMREAEAQVLCPSHAGDMSTAPPHRSCYK